MMMKFISFAFAYIFLRILACLPLSWMYNISRFIYFIIFYIFPYRKKLVFKNLQNSFPNWDKKKVRSTAKSFFQFFCDMLIESAFSPFLSEKELEKRIKYKNLELIHELYKKRKSIIVITSHYANWEWNARISKLIDHKAVYIYKPLQNKYFDRFIAQSREKYNAKTVPMERTLRYLIEMENNKVLTLSYFLADQRPLKKNIQYWTTFLNQDTPIYTGPEKIARKLNMAVIFQKTRRKSRGFYESEFILLSENPSEMKEFEIMELYFKKLEESIYENPQYWLWTHNRWKYDKKDFISTRKIINEINKE